MFNDEKDLIKSINELTNCLERLLEQEVDVEITSGELQITITKIKREPYYIPEPSDVKLLDMDEFDRYVESLSGKV